MRWQAIATEKQAMEREFIVEQTEFIALCAMLNKHATNIPQSLDELKQYNSSMKKELEQQTLVSYVNASLKEAMEKLGYSVCQTEILHAPTKSIDKMTFNFSNTSCLNVASATDGAVMFEVVGKSKSSGKGAVRRDMEKFCPDYGAIKEALHTKGITLENETLYPASEEYVRFNESSTKQEDQRTIIQKRKKMQLNG